MIFAAEWLYIFSKWFAVDEFLQLRIHVKQRENILKLDNNFSWISQIFLRLILTCFVLMLSFIQYPQTLLSYFAIYAGVERAVVQKF